MKQIKLLGAHAGAVMAFGALGFHKGLSQPMSEADAQIHLTTLQAVGANADVEVAEGEERPPFVAVYEAEIVDVAPAGPESAVDAPATPAASVPMAFAVGGGEDDE